MNGDIPVQPASNQTDSPWQYKPGGDSAQPAPQVSPSQNTAFKPVGPTEITWTASEFIEHSKSPLWYLMLAGATGAILAIVFLWTRDVVSLTAIAIMAFLYGIMAARKPRTMEYHLDSQGVAIGAVVHPYAEFKSFAIIDEGAFSAISFMPFKRFMPPVGIYYEPQDQERILEVLTQYLPMEMQEPDMIDRFARRIRF